MGRKRRPAAIAAGVTVLALGLAACGSSGSGASTTPKAGSTGSKAHPITITLDEHQQIRASVLEKVLPSFESAMAARGQYIHVKLIANILPDPQFQTVLTEDYNAGTAADVNDYPLAWSPDYAGAGYLLNLTPYLDKWSGWSQFYPRVKDQAVQANGATYGLVHEASIQQIFYRADVLKRLGVSTSAPTTWGQFIARLQEIKAKTGQAPFVIPVGTAWAAPEQGLDNVLLGTGSTIYDQAHKKWVVKSPGLNYVFNLLYELRKDGLIPTQDLLSPTPWEATKYKAFVQGTLPVAFQGTWGWGFDWGPQGTAPIAGLSAKVKTWYYPAAGRGTPYVDAYDDWAWAVSNNTHHAEAAVELSEWLTTGKPLADMLNAVGAASPRTGLDNVAPYSQDPHLLTAERLFTSSVTKALKPEPGEAEVDEAFEMAEEAILTGKTNGSGAASLFAQQATTLLHGSNVEG